jgi:hypothetical protein
MVWLACNSVLGHFRVADLPHQSWFRLHPCRVGVQLANGTHTGAGAVTAPSVIALDIPRSSTSPRGARDGVTPLPRQPLPLPKLPPHRTSAVVYGASAVDDRGLVTELNERCCAHSGWPPRHRLTIQAAGGTLTVTPRPGRRPPGHRAGLSAHPGRTAPPVRAGHRGTGRAGRRPRPVPLVIYPPAALDLAMAAATANGGDPA